MFRKHEKSVTWKAGMLAAAVHIVLFGALVFAAKWKAAHTVISVSEVQLWDKLPGKTIPKPPEIKPTPPEVEKTPEPPEIEEKPPEPDPKVEEKPDPEVEIALKKKEDEKKKAEEEKKKKLEAKKKKKLAEKRKKAAKKKKLLAKLLQEDLKQKNEALEKLQREINGEGDDTEKQTAANAGVVNEYIGKITNKIHGNVNPSLCGDGNPVLRFKIGLLPTGEFRGSPTLIKSSGNAVCDDAVERAIIASEPLPLPPAPEDFSRFRDFTFTFHPNGN